MTICGRRVLLIDVAFLLLLAAFVSKETLALSSGVKPPRPSKQELELETTTARASRFRTTVATTTKSYVELFDPKNNTEVILLGCLHGSLSSSIDVKNLLLGEVQGPTGGDKVGDRASNVQQQQENQFLVPDVVVLELCQARYGGIVASREEIIEEYSNEDFWEDMTNYWKRTLQQNDDDPILALLKIMLGTTSLIQTQLSGIRAGLEFEVAMDIVEAYNSSNNRDNVNNRDKVVRLVLGDRNIDETMNRIGSLPSVSLQLLRDNNTDDEYNGLLFASIWRESNRLWTAILGDQLLPKNSQICMPKVLLRNSQAKKDLGRQLLLPSLVATVVALLLAWIARGFEWDPYDVLLWGTLLSFDDDIELQTKISAFTALSWNSLADLVAVLAGYILLALPASKVIVSERDGVLKECIIDAIVSAPKMEVRLREENEEESPSPRKIVAILGLLHVNGVAKQLLEECGFNAIDKK